MEFSKLHKKKYTAEAIAANPELEAQSKVDISSYGNEIVSINVGKFTLTPGMQGLLTIGDLDALADIIDIVDPLASQQESAPVPEAEPTTEDKSE